MQLSSDMAGYLDSGWRFLLREPERSRRVLQLVYANWLAHRKPRAAPRKPAVRALFSLLTSTNPVSRGTTNVTLYPVSPLGTGRSPLAFPEGDRKLAGHHQRRQATNRGEQQSMALVSGSSSGPQGIPRPRPHACREIYHREHGAPTF